jgi:hypothetical protein
MIDSTAIINANASIGHNVKIGPYCIIGPDVKIKDNVELKSHVVIEGVTVIGEGTIIYPFASLGQNPQILKYEGEKSKVVIGNDPKSPIWNRPSLSTTALVIPVSLVNLDMSSPPPFISRRAFGLTVPTPTLPS